MKLSPWLVPLITSLALLVSSFLLGGETWIRQVSPVQSLDPDDFATGRLYPWGDEYFLPLAGGAYSGEPFEGFIRLDAHGNVQWMLDHLEVHSGGRFFIPPLSIGNILLLEGGWPDLSCSSGMKVFEITPEGEIVMRKHISCLEPQTLRAAYQTESGYLLAGSSRLHQYNEDFSTLLWGVYLQTDPPPNPPIPNASIHVVLRNGDGTLTLQGKFMAPGQEDPEYRRYFLAKLDNDGSLLWQKTYDCDHTQYLGDFFSMLPAAGGGYWLLGGFAHPPAQPGYQSWPFLARVDSEGEIEWQRVFCIEGRCQGGGFNQALQTDDGGFVAVGGSDAGSGDWPNAFIMRVGPDGEPQWIQQLDDGITPYPWDNINFDHILDAGDGYLLPVSLGTSLGETPPWIFRVGPNGHLGEECGPYFNQPSVTTWEMEPLEPWDGRLVVREAWAPPGTDTEGDLVFKDLMNTTTVCGDVFPGVLEIMKKRDPLRLKLIGWNFEEGSRVLVDGVEVPKSTFKGADRESGRTILIAKKGKRLKKMLPKGREVCITVLNPDGRESVCYHYTR